mmetsp:Transcript_25841/g.39033  ORF Transcript_25841/g.39033 Transcript_25841/m.39033 type:complete len:263 (-) Transcript_25841:182-970(-)
MKRTHRQLNGGHRILRRRWSIIPRRIVRVQEGLIQMRRRKIQNHLRLVSWIIVWRRWWIRIIMNMIILTMMMIMMGVECSWLLKRMLTLVVVVMDMMTMMLMMTMTWELVPSLVKGVNPVKVRARKTMILKRKKKRKYLHPKNNVESPRKKRRRHHLLHLHLCCELKKQKRVKMSRVRWSSGPHQMGMKVFLQPIASMPRCQCQTTRTHHPKIPHRVLLVDHHCVDHEGHDLNLSNGGRMNGWFMDLKMRRVTLVRQWGICQ